jgi:pimeloyl-ACP methyl ester carboxylesterase
MKLSALIPMGTLLVLLAVVAGVTLPSSAGAASRCRESGARGLLCTTVAVPLDREGLRRGTLKLAVAYEPLRPGRRDLLLALSGGPGQSSVSAAASFRSALRPALRRARLVVFDQRGTGAGALWCPELQRLGDVDGVPGSAVKACARRLGPKRADFTTADTVADIEAIRKRFGASKLTIMGVSYGTHVAVQYARTYPQRVKAMILDSPIGPGGIDAFLLDSLGPLGRIVNGWCTGIRCPSSVGEPWKNLASVATTVRAKGLSARLPDARGRVRKQRLGNEGTLESLISSADLNPALQALLPGALASAAASDPAPLLRLLEAAQGPPISARELSAGLNVATICADTALPFSYADGLDTRRRKMAGALDVVPSENYAPFARETVLKGSIAADCAVWPSSSGSAPSSTSPIPEVPTLILSGSFDQRTPSENASQLAALIPGSEVVVVGGTGHDTIDTDISGCVARALARFSSGKVVGAPCDNADNRWRVAERPATRLSSVAPVKGTGGQEDLRALSAIIATVHDAELQAYAQLYSGRSSPRGGGLRGGRWDAGNGITLRSYELVRGVRVTSTDGRLRRLRVSLPSGRGARLALSSTGVIAGTVGGRAVRARAVELASLEARP